MSEIPTLHYDALHGYNPAMRYALLMIVMVCGCATSRPPATVATAAFDNPEDWFQLGNRYAEAGQLEQAEHAYRRALENGPYPKAQHNLGLVQVRLGVKALQNAREQLPAEHPAHAATREFLQLLLRSALDQAQ